jgi:hypothetical protein
MMTATVARRAVGRSLALLRFALSQDDTGLATRQCANGFFTRQSAISSSTLYCALEPPAD